MKSAAKKATEIAVRTHGPVPDDQVPHARDGIGHVLSHVGEPVIEASVTLTILKDPALPQPALVQIEIALKGRRVRAHAAAPTIHQALKIACDRLAIRLENVARDWESTRGRTHAAPRSLNSEH